MGIINRKVMDFLSRYTIQFWGLFKEDGGYLWTESGVCAIALE